MVAAFCLRLIHALNRRWSAAMWWQISALLRWQARSKKSWTNTQHYKSSQSSKEAEIDNFAKRATSSSPSLLRIAIWHWVTATSSTRKKDCLLTVADVAEGTQGIRRQRLESGSDVMIATQLQAIKVYEEINRVLAGRVDFNDLIRLCSQSFTRHDLDGAYAAFGSMITGLQAPYMQTGTMDADKLLDLVEHVEASTGESAMIIGTKKALRKIPDIDGSDSRKESLYAMGYAGKLAGTPLISMKQRHEIGSTKFILPDDTLYVVAGDTKPIKRVTEGSVTMLQGDPMKNADLSQEFLLMKRTGIGIIMDRDFGAYKFS